MMLSSFTAKVFRNVVFYIASALEIEGRTLFFKIEEKRKISLSKQAGKNISLYNM